MIYQINIFLAIINLLPIYPLDGYNILINILRGIFNANVSNSNIFMKYINNIFFLLLLVISIYQIIIFKNISILIFLIYFFLINQNRKKDGIYENILSKAIC